MPIVNVYEPTKANSEYIKAKMQAIVMAFEYIPSKLSLISFCTPEHDTILQYQ